LHCYVQTFDFGTKERKLFNAAKGYVPKRYCSCYRSKPLNYYKGAIVTIIDRSTDWLIMRKLPHDKDAFAEPHAPWQKGGIENTNGLIRQYIPNGSDFNDVSQQKIKIIQRKIKARPRGKLNFLTPDEVVYKKIS